MASWSSTTSNPAASSTATGPFWSALRVAHFIAQNAHHQTDTGIPDRHTGLNPRALAVQMDTSDRFLWSGGPMVRSPNLPSPTNTNRSLGGQERECREWAEREGLTRLDKVFTEAVDALA